MQERRPLCPRQTAYNYSQTILKEGSALTRFSHRSRFETLIRLLKGRRFECVADWGCADGVTLNLLHQKGIIEKGFGVDIQSEIIQKCKKDYSAYSNLKFLMPDTFEKEIPPNSCDLILCQEVLEHTKNPKQIFDQINKIAKPSGQIIVSVPIEVGPSLFVKQLGRFFTNLKTRYDYQKYHLWELIQAGLFWHISPFVTERRNTGETSHQGFDYREIKALIEKRFSIKRETYSPFPWLGSILNATIFWVLQKEDL